MVVIQRCMNMRKWIIYAALAGTSGLGLSGCLSNPDLSSLKTDMVVDTEFDNTANFGGFHTFVIRKDTIGLVSNQTNQTYITHDSVDDPDMYASQVVDRITNNFKNAGYSQVTADDNPDLGVYVFVLDNYDAVQQLVYPTYYPGYYGGYSSYYGYYQQAYVQTYVSQYATLVIQVVDFKDSHTITDPASVVWTAYLGDLYFAGANYISLSLDAIDQAFAQSPYLSTTK